MTECWSVRVVTDQGPGVYYRYEVEGWNRCTGEPFTWNIPEGSIGRGYDLSQAYWRRIGPSGQPGIGTAGRDWGSRWDAPPAADLT